LREYPKLFDAGDYNLFRYCHNDPIDNADPMGLADERREPWYNHEEQAKQLAKLQALLNQKLLLGYGAISVGGLQYALTQLQQTMPVSMTGQNIGARVDYGRAPMGNLNDPNAPNTLEILPVNDWDKHATYTNYRLQAKHGDKALTGDIASREHVILDSRSRSNFPFSLNTSNEEWIRGRKGVITDQVGLRNYRPSVWHQADIYKSQTYQIWYGGFRYNIPGPFIQHTTVTGGLVTNELGSESP